jgi:hypothetical protein
MVPLTIFKLSWKLISALASLGGSIHDNEFNPKMQLPMICNANLKVSLWTIGSSKAAWEGLDHPSAVIMSL